MLKKVNFFWHKKINKIINLFNDKKKKLKDRKLVKIGS